ncbi:hypothetical protein LEP1GSC188_3146 [Leptospira weilii serovar Topaz str. LT2116]|uniref:Uncharacterized protein n=1 Tax=Leptospira weilii serovar Topaz str. LT2116 TaxID=1088540 RepID=M3FKF3_9LEPT|nr:hypothetical protein LEP1GSC188_3146 [Leptospira weilii serovar Topaz str. LT2116]
MRPSLGLRHMTASFTIDHVFVLAPGFPPNAAVHTNDFLQISRTGFSTCTWLCGLEMLNPSRPGSVAIFVKDPHLPRPEIGMQVNAIEPGTIPAARKELAETIDSTLLQLQNNARQGLKLIERAHGKPFRMSSSILPPVDVRALLPLQMTFYDGQKNVLEFSLNDVQAFFPLSEDTIFARRKQQNTTVDMLYKLFSFRKLQESIEYFNNEINSYKSNDSDISKIDKWFNNLNQTNIITNEADFLKIFD